jgi:hypothetical protein
MKIPSEDLDSNLSSLPLLRIKHRQPKALKWLTLGARPCMSSCHILFKKAFRKIRFPTWKAVFTASAQYLLGVLCSSSIVRAIFPLNYSVLTSHIGRRKLMFETQITIKGFETRVFKFTAIVTMNSSNSISTSLILQPRD